MSLKRTPPPSCYELKRTDSEPSMSIRVEDEEFLKIGTRKVKRRRDETDGKEEDTTFESAFEAWSKTQNSKLTEILATVNELKKQNDELRTTCEFNAGQYEAILKEFRQMEEERKSNLKYIKLLEDKVETLERNSRSACFEIHNISTNKTETKDDLVNLLVKTSTVLKSPIQPCEIRNIFRAKSKSESTRPVIVELNSVLSKERVLRAAKKFNSENKSNKLNSKHLGLEGLEKPVYISENLTPKARRLFFRARELKRSKAYLFCWTSNGNVFIRKSEDDPAIPVESELQIDRLLPK